MAAIDMDELRGRLQRLDHLVTAYGHILIASELERPLPAVIPLLTSDDVTESKAGELVKEILRRGGAALVIDLEEIERLIRQGKKDPQVTAALRGVRLAFRQTARLHASALARRIGRAAQTGAAAGPDAASLQKELEAFVSGVAHVVKEDDVEFEEVFADEDLLTDAEAPVSSEHSQASPGEVEALPDHHRSFLYKEEPDADKEEPDVLEEEPVGPEEDPTSTAVALEIETVEAGGEPQPPSWDSNGSDPDERERPLDWLRDRVDVYNEMLARWGTGEVFVPRTSPLVRRGILTPERCADLYHDLLTGGPDRLVDRVEELEALPGGVDDRLRYLRSRIADGLATGVPRILALLVSGESLPADLDDASRGGRGALANLNAYLTRAVDLFDEASPLHSRLVYLSSELRSAVRSTSA